jgi:hypothetical protein
VIEASGLPSADLGATGDRRIDPLHVTCRVLAGYGATSLHRNKRSKTAGKLR